MSDESDKKNGQSHSVVIIVATLSLIGVIATALFANWDKIFPANISTQPTSSQSPAPQTTTPLSTKTNKPTSPKSDKTVSPSPIISPSPTALPEMSDYDVGVDRFGSDYKDTTVSGGVDECREICRKDTRCQSFSFNQSANQCWLKNAVPLKRPENGFISGVKKTQ